MKLNGIPFQPDGRLTEMSDEEIKEHNLTLQHAELCVAIEDGHGIFYHKIDENFKNYVQTWLGDWIWPARVRFSNHNMAGKNGRRDFWWTMFGQKWHGVNIGDNDIIRANRVKD
ncbi:MAG: hypothetical protein PHS93_09685 [Candidatus Omnitrophica bacterium]|nr:hypothetical protein [Candidatus Omnitrophota bacterium]